MLSVQGLSVRYGRSVRALSDVDIEVPGDGVLAVLGGNGAGKSTLLRAVSGTLRLHRGAVTAGTITFDGGRLDRLDPAAIVRSGVGAVPEGRQVFARMSVEENLRAGGLGARSATARTSARARVLELFPVLAERAGQRAGLLSGGEQQMLVDRQGADGGPEAAAARRAVAGPGTADGRPDRPDHPRDPRAGHRGRARRAERDDGIAGRRPRRGAGGRPRRARPDAPTNLPPATTSSGSTSAGTPSRRRRPDAEEADALAHRGRRVLSRWVG